ncbi:MAG: hypothetical protein R3F43_09325 [bacterium]
MRRHVVNQLQAVQTEACAARPSLSAAAFLPALDAPLIARAGRLTGFRGFSRRDPFRPWRAAETCSRRRWPGPKRTPGTSAASAGGARGELTEKLKEIKDTAAPFEAECARFEALPRFMDLIESGCDTPASTARGGRRYTDSGPPATRSASCSSCATSAMMCCPPTRPRCASATSGAARWSGSRA